MEELEAGLNGVGALIHRSGGEVVAAMSVDGPTFRLPLETLWETGRLTVEASTARAGTPQGWPFGVGC